MVLVMRNAILLDDGPVATAYPDSRIYRWQTAENVRAREFAYEDSSPGLKDPTMKRAIVLACSAAILACMATSPVVAQPGAAGVATYYGGGWRSDYRYTPRKRKCRSWMSRWRVSQPVRAYPANQISTTSGGSPDIRSDRTRPGGGISRIPASVSASSRYGDD